MDKDHINRKLTAIFSTDVAGYSRLMGDDEEATVHTLKKYKKIICELIEGNKGRVIDSPGDNLLAEFVSVVDAVRCAILIQNDLKANNETLSSDRKMEFRIGINIGDVIQDGERIYGDGVNVAARIESLAEPGGICISRNAYDQVKKKMHIQYEYLGEHEVKNIDEAVRVYKVLIDSITDELFGEEGTIESAHLQSVDYPQSDKPSIVVLPFVNISGDPEQEYFSDGITEELISALARIQGLRVIPRTSAFYFKGEHVDLQTVCEKLNVENVIEGSIRKAGNKLRITAKLIKAAGDRHLWSETYNRELDDVFTIQEEISTAIVDNLRIRLLGKEKESLAKPYTKNIEAYEAYIKGRYYYLSFTNEGRKKALQYYEEAVRLDPCYALAYSAIAEYYWGTPSKGPRTISRDEAYTRAMEAINTALEIDNSIPEAYATLGIIKMHYEWDIKGAEKAYKTAVDLNPGLSKVHYDYAFYLAITGDINNAFLEARKSIELDPLFGLTHMCYGICLLVSGQYDQALEKLLQGHEMMPTYVDAFTCLASVYILKGMFDEAMDEIIKGLEIAPGEHILLSQLGHINSLKGKKEKTQEILNELLEISKKEFVNPVAVASLYIDLEETDKAFEWLEKSCETREISFYFLMAGQLRFLYLDPRVNPFFKKLGV